MTKANRDRLTKIVDLAAPVARVWRAVSDHEEFGQWFRVRLDGPFEVGATTSGRMTYPGQEHVAWESRTEEIVPERRFVFSWPPGAIDPDTEYAADARVVVTFELEPTDGGTRLTITESGFGQFSERCRLDVLRACERGWHAQAENIAAHVAG